MEHDVLDGIRIQILISLFWRIQNNKGCYYLFTNPHLDVIRIQQYIKYSFITSKYVLSSA